MFVDENVSLNLYAKITLSMRAASHAIKAVLHIKSECHGTYGFVC